MASRTQRTCRQPTQGERHVTANQAPRVLPPSKRSRVTWVRLEDLPPLDPARRREVRWIRVDQPKPSPVELPRARRHPARGLILAGVIAESAVAVAGAVAWRWNGSTEPLAVAVASAAIALLLLRYV